MNWKKTIAKCYLLLLVALLLGSLCYSIGLPAFLAGLACIVFVFVFAASISWAWDQIN